MIAVQVGPFCSVAGSMRGWAGALPGFHGISDTRDPVHPNSWALDSGMTQRCLGPLPWFLGALGSLHAERK